MSNTNFVTVATEAGMIDATIRLAEAAGDAHLRACFPVMQLLRPHLDDADEFVAQIHRQALQGYRILLAWRDDVVVGLAGYRLQENTLCGRFVYVDDLVTKAGERGKRIGAMLLDALAAQSGEQGCTRLVLDTGLGNALAQRFYFRQGLLATGLHFNLSITENT